MILTFIRVTLCVFISILYVVLRMIASLFGVVSFGGGIDPFLDEVWSWRDAGKKSS